MAIQGKQDTRRSNTKVGRVYGDTVRNLLLCMGVPSPWGAPPMARFARVVVPGLPHNKPRYRG
jgi:hypothetical protein